MFKIVAVPSLATMTDQLLLTLGNILDKKLNRDQTENFLAGLTSIGEVVEQVPCSQDDKLKFRGFLAETQKIVEHFYHRLLTDFPIDSNPADQPRFIVLQVKGSKSNGNINRLYRKVGAESASPKSPFANSPDLGRFSKTPSPTGEIDFASICVSMLRETYRRSLAPTPHGLGIFS